MNSSRNRTPLIFPAIYGPSFRQRVSRLLGGLWKSKGTKGGDWCGIVTGEFAVVATGWFEAGVVRGNSRTLWAVLMFCSSYDSFEFTRKFAQVCKKLGVRFLCCWSRGIIGDLGADANSAVRLVTLELLLWVL
ncbi:hypothetical protein Droror1_Dr00016120, partial [Drosera rotundifolia]